MRLKNKYKIALVGYRLDKGGAERQMANLSLHLDEIGVEVHIITVLSEVGYPYAGKIFHTKNYQLGDGTLGRISRLWYMRQYFLKENFDYIIDFRFRTKNIQELFIKKWIYKLTPVVYRVESFLIDHYISKNKLIANLIYKNCLAIVCITEKIREKIYREYKFKNLRLVYNGLVQFEKPNLLNNMPSEYILAVGSMENDLKQFDHLLKAYAQLETKIPLYILGEGVLKSQYISMIHEFDLQNDVELLGFKRNVLDYMGQAKFLVMSSKYEGFPNVILESLACGTPVVSYNCDSGPSEIIIHRKNGLLVENQNIQALSNAMDELLKNHILYEICKLNAKGSVEKFNLNKIGLEWVRLLGLK